MASGHCPQTPTKAFAPVPNQETLYQSLSWDQKIDQRVSSGLANSGYDFPLAWCLYL